MISLLFLLKLSEAIYDDFHDYDESIWTYSDQQCYTVFKPLWYRKSAAHVGAELSKGEGTGLQMKMYASPEAATSCSGAKMISAHLGAKQETGYGDYTAVLRAPHTYEGDDSAAASGAYGYFTAGFAKKDGYWNEFTFGFHPDRSKDGHSVSCEIQGDTGGYNEVSKDIGQNLRAGFHSYRIKHRPCDVSWWVDGKCIHVSDKCLTHKMTTRFILRMNEDKAVDPHKMEVATFEFKPWNEQDATRPANLTLEDTIAWHQEHDGFWLEPAPGPRVVSSGPPIAAVVV